MVRLKLDWSEESAGAELSVTGDVGPVVYSRANELYSVPESLTHGLGALTAGEADEAGEGMLFRGLSLAAPPGERAGEELVCGKPLSKLRCPFLMAWKGEPSAVGSFSCDEPESISALYTAIFHELVAADIRGSKTLILVETIALVPLQKLFDRALKTPVHEGNCLITSDEHKDRYWRFGINAAHFSNTPAVIPMVFSGIGINTERASTHEELQGRIFYQAPGASGARETVLKTHTHGCSWDNAGELQEILERKNYELAGLADLDEKILPTLLSRAPACVAHIEEWSELLSGFVKIYLVKR